MKYNAAPTSRNERGTIVISRIILTKPHPRKAGSSGFIKKRRWINARFEWQEGFGAFSYSHSQLTTDIRCIQNQERHHARSTFREEYLEMLRKFNVVHDDKYIFQPVE